MQNLREENTRISLELNHEIRYWTQQLQCTKDELRRAVKKAGSCATAVRRELGR
jgi:hypothetical protein